MHIGMVRVRIPASSELQGLSRTTIFTHQLVGPSAGPVQRIPQNLASWWSSETPGRSQARLQEVPGWCHHESETNAQQLVTSEPCWIIANAGHAQSADQDAVRVGPEPGQICPFLNLDWMLNDVELMLIRGR